MNVDKNIDKNDDKYDKMMIDDCFTRIYHRGSDKTLTPLL